MSIKETTSFVTADGHVFFTRAEAEAYEAHQAAVTKAAEYGGACIAAGLNERAASRRVAAVVGYIEWRQTGVVPGAAGDKAAQEEASLA